MHVLHDFLHAHDKMNLVENCVFFIGRLIFLAKLEAHIARDNACASRFLART